MLQGVGNAGTSGQSQPADEPAQLTAARARETLAYRPQNMDRLMQKFAAAAALGPRQLLDEPGQLLAVPPGRQAKSRSAPARDGAENSEGVPAATRDSESARNEHPHEGCGSRQALIATADNARSASLVDQIMKILNHILQRMPPQAAERVKLAVQGKRSRAQAGPDAADSAGPGGATPS